MSANAYFVRPRISIKAWARRMEKKRNALRGQEVFNYARYKKGSDMVLLQYRSRGIDPISKNKYETKSYLVVESDFMLREVKKPPGYTHK